MTGALAFGAPSTAAAAMLAPKVTKGTLALALVPLLAPPVISITAGLALIVVLMRRLIRSAIDDQEKKELRRFRNLSCGLVVGFHLALIASLACFRILGDSGVALAFLLSWLGFGFGGGYLLSHRLPTILARRRAQEREANPEAFAKAESRRRWRSLGVLGLAIAAFFAAFALIVYRV